jgi:hypothetical protein
MAAACVNNTQGPRPADTDPARAPRFGGVFRAPLPGGVSPDGNSTLRRTPLAGFNAQGTVVAYETATPNTYLPIAEIRSFTGPGGAATVIDATTLSSAGKEKVLGLMDEGTLGLSMNFNPGDAGQVMLRTERANQTRRRYRITFSDEDGTTATFQAFVSSYTVGGGVDALTTLEVNLEITDAITWAVTP